MTSIFERYFNCLRFWVDCVSRTESSEIYDYIDQDSGRDEGDTVSGIVEHARRGGDLLPGNVEILRKAFLRSITRSDFDMFRSKLDPFDQSLWGDLVETKRYELHCLLVMAAFVCLFRPGRYDFTPMGMAERALLRELLVAFDKASPRIEGQRNFIRRLFDQAELLEDLLKSERKGKANETEENDRIFRLCMKARGRVLADVLEKNGFAGFGERALSLFRRKPTVFYTRVSQWRARLQKPRTKLN